MVNKEEILKLKQGGLSYQKIADLLQISKSTVAYNLRGTYTEDKKLYSSPEAKPTLINLPDSDYSPDSLMDLPPIRYEIRDVLTTASWRHALYMVEMYRNYYFMHQCIRELYLDAHISAVINLRKSRISALPFFVEVNGVVDQKMHDFFDNKWFYDFLSASHNAVFEGFSLVEICDFDENGIKEVHQIPMKYVSPELHTFQKTPQAQVYTAINWDRRELVPSEQSINYLEDPNYAPFLIECIYNKEQLGILSKIVPLYIWKLTSLQMFASHAESYSSPIRIGHTSSTDKKSKDRLFHIVKQMGRSLSAVLGEGEEIELINQNQNDPGQLYNSLVNLCNHEISKIVLGGTLITDADGSRAQGTVHQDVLDDIVKADANWMRFIINNQLVKILKNLNLIPVDADINFYFNTIEDISLTQKWTIDNGIAQLGFQLDPIYLMNTYGTEILDLKSDPKEVQKQTDILKHSAIGMQNLNGLLIAVGSGQIDREAAINVLVNAYQFEPDIAEKMIPVVSKLVQIEEKEETPDAENPTEDKNEVESSDNTKEQEKDK